MSDDKREPWQAWRESRATRRAALAEDRQRAMAVKPPQRVAEAIIPCSRYLVPGSCLLGRVGSSGRLGSAWTTSLAAAVAVGFATPRRGPE
jgi:hypothetical protein